MPLTTAQKLAQDAAEAAEVRAYQTHPDVVALRIERVRTQVDRMCWAGIVLGLAFTMTNVQGFAAAGSPAWSLPWLAAWVLDPTVSLVLLAILRAEQVTARYQVRTGPWVRRAKWLTLAATYVMNTWASYAAGSLAGDRAALGAAAGGVRGGRGDHRSAGQADRGRDGRVTPRPFTARPRLFVNGRRRAGSCSPTTSPTRGARGRPAW